MRGVRFVSVRVLTCAPLSEGDAGRPTFGEGGGGSCLASELFFTLCTDGGAYSSLVYGVITQENSIGLLMTGLGRR